MRGIAIYESPFMGEMYVRAVDIRHANYTFESAIAEDASVSLSGYFSKSSQAKCSKNDTYDFETGALISLMRMCGAKKVAEACCEAFPHETSGSIYRENKRYIKRIKELEEENKRLSERQPSDLPRRLKTKNEILKKDNDRLIDTNILLIRENNKLAKENEKLTLLLEYTKNDVNKKLGYIKELKAENEKLKTDCEKLRHGYSAGLGRLVNINGVNYRECNYKESPVWMTSQPERFSFFANYIDTDALEALKGSQKKPISKREQMWDDILKEGRTPVYVKREDIHDFLEECQVVGIKWSTGKFALETIPFHISAGYDGVYFFVMTSLDISKSTPGAKEFSHTMTWWSTACPAEAEAAIHYIRPMRWDLFEKGRIYVKVKPEHFEEFQKACRSHLERGKAPNTHYFNDDSIVVNLPKEGRFCVTKDLRGFKKRPVVDWEDVR